MDAAETLSMNREWYMALAHFWSNNTALGSVQNQNRQEFVFNH